MDLFNGNRKLEEITMNTLDWGIFLRHQSDDSLMPFLHLYQDGKLHIRVMASKGSAIEQAKQILKHEKGNYQQFVVGMEGVLRIKSNERTNAIVVQGFDRTKEKGTSIAQEFLPKKSGMKFKKKDKPLFLGNPDLIVPIAVIPNPIYGIQEIGFNAIKVGRTNELFDYVAYFTHDNPTVIANTIKKFFRSKINDPQANKLSGKFQFEINPGLIKNDRFLKFVILTVLEEERNSEMAKTWSAETNRLFQFNIKHWKTDLHTEFQVEP